MNEHVAEPFRSILNAHDEAPKCPRAADDRKLIDQLVELTKRWTTYEDIPMSQQRECRDIGKKLHAIGGTGLMRDAYYAATAHNRAATVIAAYFDGIGDWQW